MLPALLPLDQLPSASSLNMTVMSAGAIAGPLIGGALIPIFGFPLLYLIDTVCLFATLWAVVNLPKLPPQGERRGTPGVRSVLDGLRYLLGHPILLTSFLVDGIAMIFGMPRALFPQIAHESFGGPVEGGLAFALLFAAMPAGAVLGDTGVVHEYVEAPAEPFHGATHTRCDTLAPMPSLPVTAFGKVDKNAIVRRVLDGR